MNGKPLLAPQSGPLKPPNASPADASLPPAVSVVIPTYNYAAYLGEAISSVLRQDHANFEILVVDDGSTDDTAHVVSRFTDTRVRYVHQTNAGLSSARNTGIRGARHEIIALLDADDMWLPAHLSSSISHFARLDPAFAIVASPHRYVDASGGDIPSRATPIQPEREIPVADVVLKTRFMPSAVLIRREVFAECGYFDTSLRSSEDRDMWIRIGSRHRIFLQNQTTVLIRKHTANMSSQTNRMRASMRTVICRAYSSHVVSRFHLAFWLKTWALFCFQSAWAFHDEGRNRKAVCYVLASIGICPWPVSASALNVPPLFRIRALARFVGLIPPDH